MWMAVAELIVANFLHFYIVYMCVKHKDALQNEMPIYMHWGVIVTIATILSLFLFPGKRGEYFVSQQMFVSFTMFTEALSLVPQLYHMYISRGLEGLNSKYLFALAISRFSRIYFWYTMSGRHITTFWYLISSDALYTIMVLGFALLFRSTRKTHNEGDGILGVSMKREERND